MTSAHPPDVPDAELLSTLFEDSPMPIAFHDQRGRAYRKNDAYVAFEAAYGAAAGLSDGTTELGASALCAQHAAALDRALCGEAFEYAFDVAPHPASAGATEADTLTFSRLLIPIRREDAVRAVVSLLIDTTEQRQAEQERARFQERLVAAQKLESLGVLAGGIAHDFNNLLAAMLGHASVLATKLGSDSPLLRHVAAIETAAKRAGEIARQMLVYSGRSGSERGYVDVAAATHELVDLLQVSIPKRATLRLHTDPGTPMVLGDAAQMRQVILNLITNAAEALPETGGAVTLNVRPVARGEVDLSAALVELRPGNEPLVCLEVRDEGRGMDEATRRRIFEPFFSTKALGRGLGLSAVLGIVRGHGGTLTLESSPGVGTCLRVLLPAAERVSGVRSMPPVARMTTGARVLVVDDEPSVRDVLLSMLEAIGAFAHGVEDGEQALRAARRERYTLALVDITMPGLDGNATAARLRAEHPDLRIVLMSGDKQPTDRSAQFVPKPFPLDTLRALLQQTPGPESQA